MADIPKEAINAFVAERDAMLLKCDVDEMLAFFAKWNPDLPAPTCREVAERMLHKARTASKGLPITDRQKSKEWLAARGSSSFDDGDL